eukprot:9925906-Karenia_brevis.AAC.1
MVAVASPPQDDDDGQDGHGDLGLISADLEPDKGAGGSVAMEVGGFSAAITWAVAPDRIRG